MGGLTSAASCLAAVIALVAGSYIAAGANRSDRSALRRYLAAALITIGVATAVGSPLTVALATALDVPPNVVHFVGDVLGVVASFCVLAMLAHANYRPEAARRLIPRLFAGLIATGLVMVALLLLALTSTANHFAAAGGINLFAGGYELLYLASVAAGMANFLWLIHCQIRHGDDRLRPVLRMNAVAAGLGVVWVAWKVTALAAARAGAHLPVDQAVVSELLATLVVTLIALGCTASVWLAWLARRADHLRARHAVARLTPLWTTLTTAVPDVSLGTNDHSGPEYALYRRIIEIRDAQMALRVLAEPNIHTRARAAARRHGVRPGRDTALVVEAAELATALRAHQVADLHPGASAKRDYPMGDIPAISASGASAKVGLSSASGPESATAISGQIGHTGPDQTGRSHSGLPANVCAEAHWLVRLSRTLATSPVVDELLQDSSDNAFLIGGSR